LPQLNRFGLKKTIQMAFTLISQNFNEAFSVGFPFSIGDLFYAFLVLVIIFRTVQFIKYIFKKKVNRQYLLNGLKQVIFFFLFVYLFFYGLWGLNYSRKGVSYQINLEMKKYSLQEIDTLTDLLQKRLNFYADTIDLKQRDSFNKKRILFDKTTEAYLYANNLQPFLRYDPQSLKPSLFSYLGNYFGFQGYYNPFSGRGPGEYNHSPFP
jgi:hypothetical protein